MKLKGYSVVWRPKGGEWRFSKSVTYDETTITAAVFATHREALDFLAEKSYGGGDEVQVVEVTLTTKGFKQ